MSQAQGFSTCTASPSPFPSRSPSLSSLYLSLLSFSLSVMLSGSPSLSPPPALTLSLSLPRCLSLSLCLSPYRKKLVAPCRVLGSVVWPGYWVRGSPYPLLYVHVNPKSFAMFKDVYVNPECFNSGNDKLSGYMSQETYF